MDHSDLEDTKCASAAQSWLGCQKSSQLPRAAKGPFCLSWFAKARPYPVKVTK